VRFERAEDSEDLTVLGDAGQLEQALVALFVNAVEAMPDGGALRVAVASDPATGGARLSVSDTGTGITPEDLPHIFEPFFTTKSAGKGVGLGLSVAYGIMQRHGGSLSAESRPGAGATFTLAFPSPEAAAARPPADPADDAARVPGREGGD
jgi:signal transduction histidine kinase